MSGKGNFFVNKNIHTSDIKKMINFFLKKPWNQ